MKTFTAIAIAAVLAAGTVAASYFFDIEVTQTAELPDVNVDVEGGQLPKVDVNTGSVEMGTKTVTVTVPEVNMVEKEVSVPTVNVEPAKD
ncbi:hypothetical protein ACFQ14_08680 [Pseudahrensia aquimaris]|uniref:Uncharacterized protein n=1 Tax=Pseudahrensia aquimaris TaxID=744461 RepID=A0ABW3FE74_9HYPH